MRININAVAQKYRVMFFLLVFMPASASALEQHEKLWVGSNLQRPLTADKKWSYLLFTQTRFINKSHPWNSTLFEGGVGYGLSATQLIWLGYRWAANQPNNGFFQENRLWQQFDGVLRDVPSYKMYSRARLEESEFSNQSQISCRLRERVLLLFEEYTPSKVSPQFYDEAFFQLNRTNYTTHNFLSENRIFIGARIRVTDKTFWEIGYINQYLFNVPDSNANGSPTQNQMNHVISINYNYV